MDEFHGHPETHTGLLVTGEEGNIIKSDGRTVFHMYIRDYETYEDNCNDPECTTCKYDECQCPQELSAE